MIWIACSIALLGGAVTLSLVARQPEGSPIREGPVASPAARVAPAGFPPPRAWTSVAWNPSPNALLAGRGDVVGVHGMTAVGDRLVAWGRMSAPNRNQFNEAAAVFLSDRGGPWRHAVITDGVAPGDTAEVSGVIASPRGLLAFGGTCCGIEERAVWGSSDGERWARVPLRGDLNPRRTYLTDAVATSDGWVMAGIDVDGRSTTLWHSVDGAEWTAGAMDPLPGPFRVMALAAAPGSIYAVGSVDDPDGTIDGLVLRSDDQGRSWQRLAARDAALALDEQAMLYDVVPHANGLLATGESRALDASDACGGAARMTASLEPLPPPRPVTAISCAWGAPALWVSDDGREWERIDPVDTGLPPSGLGPTLATGPGLVTLAQADGPALAAELHASADGTAWVRVAADEQLVAASPLGLSVVSDRLYALVEEFDGASSVYRVWIGTIEPDD